jgi:hypothetical protein
MDIKSKILLLIEKTLLTKVNVKHCSQTIYQTLLGCLRLWDSTNEVKWKERAKHLCNILMSIQRPDGGFDIGYDFNFGKLHKKGESTSPELISLMALVEYYKRFGGEDVKKSADRAVYWIKKNAIKISDGKWAIPYAPHSTKEVMVYNGTSFAASALGIYISVFPNPDLEAIYHGMINYLHDVLSSFPDQPGKFWYYSDQSRKDLTVEQRNKIDYYHQMQQVEMHSISQICFNSPVQTDLITLATENVTQKQNDVGIIPYYNFNTDIHLWGYCSCASGLILAGKVTPKKQEEYNLRAIKILEWILTYSWNGNYFYPIVSEKGVVIDKKFYVRSDAWVFNSFALAVNEGINIEKFRIICEESYRKMESVGFSGIENHASNNRIRTVFKLIAIGAKLKHRIWPK